MFDFDSMIARQRKWMLYFLALFVLGAGFLPYTSVFNGLVLGGVISFYNLWSLQHKTKVFGDTVAQAKKARGGLGTLSRMAAAVLGVIIAMRFEEHFHLMAVIIGLVSSYLVIFLDVLIRLLSNKKKQKYP